MQFLPHIVIMQSYYFNVLPSKIHLFCLQVVFNLLFYSDSVIFLYEHMSVSGQWKCFITELHFYIGMKPWLHRVFLCDIEVSFLLFCITHSISADNCIFYSIARSYGYSKDGWNANKKNVVSRMLPGSSTSKFDVV